MKAYIEAYISPYIKAGIGIISIANPFDSLDISDMGYTSTQIDEYLIYHADVLGTNNATMDIRGNENPTSVSAAARQTLFNNYVLVNYNSGYTP
jgi:hypothetical protein